MTIPVGFAQVNFRYGGPSLPQKGEWTLGLNLEGSGKTPAQVGADLFAMYAAANFDTSIASGVDLAEILVKFGPDQTGASAVVPAVETGKATGAAPANTAYLVRKLTGAGGRAGRGRLYMPGVPESMVGGDGDLDNTWQANLQTAWNTFYTSFGPSDFSPVLLHQDGSPISAPSLITSFQLDGMVATQRRRLRR